MLWVGFPCVSMRSEKPAARSMLRQSAVVITLLCRHKGRDVNTERRTRRFEWPMMVLFPMTDVNGERRTLLIHHSRAERTENASVRQGRRSAATQKDESLRARCSARG